MRVTTYQSPSGATINLTADQVAELERRGIWPRDGQGEEYCNVAHGEHDGTPTFSGAELARIVCNEVERLTAIQRELMTSQQISAELRQRVSRYNATQFASFWGGLEAIENAPYERRPILIPQQPAAKVVPFLKGGKPDDRGGGAP